MRHWTWKSCVHPRCRYEVEQRFPPSRLAGRITRPANLCLPNTNFNLHMPYYIRVLSTSERVVPASKIAATLAGATLTVEGGTDDQWDELLLAQTSGEEIAVIERNVVTEGSMAAEELEEFIEELEDLKPASGAEWLRSFLPGVKAIYAFQILSGFDKEVGWSAIGTVKSKLWNELGGILQADGEGFSNEDGYQVVWQFSDRVSGPWWMGVLKDGAWVHFEMELGDKAQRDAFFQGDVPAGAKLSK
jgi:hypothetical protein